MRVQRKAGIIATAALAGVLAWPLFPDMAKGSSLSEQAQQEAEQARKMIEEAVGSLIAGLKLVMDSIPQYEAPEVLENGDILIRRKRAEPASDETGQDI